MTTKKGKIKSWRIDSKPEHRLIERAVIVRLANSDPAQVATFDAVIASENPVERWDDQRKEVVQEILAGYTPQVGTKLLKRGLKSGEWRIVKVKIEALP